MNRTERRTRERQQAKTAAALQHRANPPRSAREALEHAQRLFQLGKAKDALPGLRQAVAMFPDDPDLRGALGYAFASSGLLSAAIEQYQVLLGLRPDAVPVLTNLAYLLARTNDIDGAREHLERASALDPEHANTAFAFAELLAKQKRRDEAFQHFRRAARLFLKKVGPRPGIQHCDDLVKLATAQLWTGDLGPGIRSLDLAVELRPDHALAHARRGMALAKLRRTPEAIVSLKRAADLEPNFSEVRRVLGDVLLTSGDTEKAQEYFVEAVRINPQDELSKYFLSAARHEAPDAPPPSYVVNLFDSYAQTFEQHLVDVLQYRAPEQVCSALLELAGASAVDWSVVDLGCGTGLCGPLIRHAAKRLIGVDLSVGMLDKAREKAVYDELKLGDVAAVLNEYADAFDLALCTDVMIYLGNLTPIFTAAARALKPGALFAFTVEVHSGEGFTLDVSGRYLHSRGYVESLANTHGFAVVQFDSIVARYQNREPDIHNLFIVKRVK
jgi:predicted TPR repeat methyltransferase